MLQNYMNDRYEWTYKVNVADDEQYLADRVQRDIKLDNHNAYY